MTPVYFWAYMAGYWIPALYFYLMDIHLFRMFPRIDDANPSEFHQKYMASIPYVLFNQFGLNLPTLYYISHIVQNTPANLMNDTLYFIVNNIVTVILFSLFHHLLHHPLIYAYVHKFHHEHKQTIAVTSERNHPIEQFFTWVIATWCPLLFFPLSHKPMIVYCVLQAAYGVIGHAGYLIPGFREDIIRHNIHHKLFKYNYGGFKIYDVIMGTNQ
jgi:sterol desaturase/sphingolipid hydroxylase (fatty acid hydroxylase superfamily)